MGRGGIEAERGEGLDVLLNWGIRADYGIWGVCKGNWEKWVLAEETWEKEIREEEQGGIYIVCEWEAWKEGDHAWNQVERICKNVKG